MANLKTRYEESSGEIIVEVYKCDLDQMENELRDKDTLIEKLKTALQQTGEPFSDWDSKEDEQWDNI